MDAWTKLDTRNTAVAPFLKVSNRSEELYPMKIIINFFFLKERSGLLPFG